jgi:hypothetical protein
VIKYTVIVDKYCTKWYLNGLLHREDGPACEYANGNKEWLRNGKLHREDGPALEDIHGNKEWYLNGNRHRENGPAIEFADGRKYWYLNSVKHTEEQFLAKTKKIYAGKIVEIDGVKYQLTPISKKNQEK